LVASERIKQADIFQYQSYSHSDDMFIILKSNINTDTSIRYRSLISISLMSVWEVNFDFFKFNVEICDK
jgi:hypothetical protein